MTPTAARPIPAVRLLVLAAVLALAGRLPCLFAEESATPVEVHDNMDVGLEYTLTVDGAVVDSADSAKPFRYIHGQKQMIPGLERQLTGLHIGDTKEVTVNPEEGYGQVDPSAFVEVSKTQLPAGITPEVGLVLRGVNPDGQSFRARISELKDETVMLDLNHPLAGKTLNFKVKVTDIAPAKHPSSSLPPSGQAAPVPQGPDAQQPPQANPQSGS